MTSRSDAIRPFSTQNTNQLVRPNEEKKEGKYSRLLKACEKACENQRKNPITKPQETKAVNEEELKQRVSLIRSTFACQAGELAKLNTELESQIAQNALLQSAKNSLETEVSELTTTKETLEGEVEGQKTKIEELQGENADLLGKKNKIEGELNKLEGDYSNLKNENDAQKRHINEVETIFKEANDIAEELTKRLNVENDNKEDLIPKLISLQQDYQRLSDKKKQELINKLFAEYKALDGICRREFIDEIKNTSKTAIKGAIGTIIILSILGVDVTGHMALISLGVFAAPGFAFAAIRFLALYGEQITSKPEPDNFFKVTKERIFKELWMLNNYPDSTYKYEIKSEASKEYDKLFNEGKIKIDIKKELKISQDKIHRNKQDRNNITNKELWVFNHSKKAIHYELVRKLNSKLWDEISEIKKRPNRVLELKNENLAKENEILTSFKDEEKEKYLSDKNKWIDENLHLVTEYEEISKVIASLVYDEQYADKYRIKEGKEEE